MNIDIRRLKSMLSKNRPPSDPQQPPPPLVRCICGRVFTPEPDQEKTCSPACAHRDAECMLTGTDPFVHSAYGRASRSQGVGERCSKEDKEREETARSVFEDDESESEEEEDEDEAFDWDIQSSVTSHPTIATEHCEDEDDVRELGIVAFDERPPHRILRHPRGKLSLFNSDEAVEDLDIPPPVPPKDRPSLALREPGPGPTPSLPPPAPSVSTSSSVLSSPTSPPTSGSFSPSAHSLSPPPELQDTDISTAGHVSPPPIPPRSERRPRAAIASTPAPASSSSSTIPSSINSAFSMRRAASASTRPLTPSRSNAVPEIYIPHRSTKSPKVPLSTFRHLHTYLPPDSTPEQGEGDWVAPRVVPPSLVRRPHVHRVAFDREQDMRSTRLERAKTTPHRTPPPRLDGTQDAEKLRPVSEYFASGSGAAFPATSSTDTNSGVEPPLLRYTPPTPTPDAGLDSGTATSSDVGDKAGFRNLTTGTSLERGRRTKEPPSDVPESPVSLRDTMHSLSLTPVDESVDAPHSQRLSTHFSTETVPLYLDEAGSPTSSSELPAVRISVCEDASGVNGTLSSNPVTDLPTDIAHLNTHPARSVSRGRPISAQGVPLHVRGPRAPSADGPRRRVSASASSVTSTALGEPFELWCAAERASHSDVWESVRELRLAGSEVEEKEEELRARLATVGRSVSTLALAMDAGDSVS